MRLFVALAFYLATIPAHAIVNGQPVSDEAYAQYYPWAAIVVNNLNGGVCGGVLIAPRWVLTAAHCTSNNRHVLLGSAHHQTSMRIEVEKSIRHSDFSIDTLQNDVGLLYLVSAYDAPVANLVTPAEARRIMRPGVSARILGWGKTETSKVPVERLRDAQIVLEKFGWTGSQYVYNFTSGPCGRDSGSPMVMRTIDGRWVVVGIASSTDGNLCSSGGGYAVYTGIARVRDFILQHTGIDSGY